MAAISGKAGSVVVGSDTLALIKNWSLDESNDLLETTNFGSSGTKEFIAGLYGASGSAEGLSDQSGTAQAALRTALTGGTSVSLKLYVDSTHYYSGTAFLSGISTSAAVEDVVGVSFNFTFSGAVSYS